MTTVLPALLLLFGAPQPMAILPVVAARDDAPRTAELFAAIHRATAFRYDVAPMSIDDFYSSDGDELAIRAARCASDVPCIADAVRGARVGSSTASLALLLVLNLEVDPAIVAVDLLSAGRRTKLGSHIAPVDHRKELLNAIERVAAAALDQAGFAEGGELVVRWDPPEALVVIDGGAIAVQLGRPIPLRAGVHRVHATAAGRAPASREVTVVARQTTETALVLEEEEGSLAGSPWLWIGVGAAVVVVAGAVTAGLVLSDHCECISGDGSPCTGGCPN